MSQESPYTQLSHAQKLNIDFDALKGVEAPIELPKEINYAQHTPKSSKAWGWLLISGLLSLLGFALVDWLMAIEQAYRATHALYAFALAALSLGFMGLVVFLVWREVRSFWVISALSEEKQQLHALILLGEKRPILAALKQLANKQAQSPYARDAYQAFFSSLKPHHSSEEVLTLYRQKVTEPLKSQAETLLMSEALKGGMVNALGPNTLIQTLLLFWINLRLLKKIARYYGIRPGFLGGFRLLRIALENLAIIAATDIATDATANLMSQKALSLVTERGADALMAWKLTQRLGLALIDQLDFAKR
jgi:putative membrane protein